MTHGSAHFPNNLYGIPQKQTGQFCTFKLGQLLKYPIMLTDPEKGEQKAQSLC
jgi:hypothetical protein